jgi:hypothetical protein
MVAVEQDVAAPPTAQLLTEQLLLVQQVLPTLAQVAVDNMQLEEWLVEVA